MAFSPNFTHNILDLLTITNATMLVVLPFCAQEKEKDLQIERIIGIRSKIGCGGSFGNYS